MEEESIEWTTRGNEEEKDEKTEVTKRKDHDRIMSTGRGNNRRERTYKKGAQRKHCCR